MRSRKEAQSDPKHSVSGVFQPPAAESDFRFKRLMDSNIIGVHVADVRGNIKEANDAFLNIIGYSRDELVSGKIRWTELTPPEWKKFDQRALRQLAASGAAKPWEKEYIRKDGTRVPVVIGVAFLPGTQGECITYAIDLTERRRAERRLAGQHAVTRALAESETLEEAAPKLLKAVCESLGWELGVIWEFEETRDEIRYLAQWHRLHLKVDRFIAACRKAKFKKGVGLPGRVWATGAPAWIPDVLSDSNFPRAAAASKAGLRGALCFPVNFGGKLFGVTEFFSRNIEKPDKELLEILTATGTQFGQFVHRRRTEKAAREVEAQLKREAVQREFMANISHEFRTPIAAIKGFVETLRDGVDKPRERNEFLNIIQRHADRLSRLVEDLLDLAAHNAGEKKLKPQSLNLRSIISEFIRSIAPLAERKNISIKVNIPPRLVVNMDRRMLFRILQCLCENAINYNHQNGSITIDGALSDGWILVSIQDNGFGIPKKDMGRIFQRFQRGQKARVIKPEGTGLGLAVAKDIVEAHGGRIWADCVVGLGSTFYFTLPADSSN